MVSGQTVQWWVSGAVLSSGHLCALGGGGAAGFEGPFRVTEDVVEVTPTPGLHLTLRLMIKY